MKKNIVFLLIDSLNYSHVKSSPVELMPFFRKLQAEGFSCENMYSEAPYTEAALMSLICGQDVLDYGGYMYRYKDTPLTLFEAMQQKGYETFSNSYEPQCHPSSVARGIDVRINGVGYDVKALWSYRIKHYSELYQSGKLDDADYETLYEIIRDNLESWIKWTDDLIDGNLAADMIGSNAPQYDPQKVKEKVELQYRGFLKDKRQYIDELLKTGHSHELFTIEGFAQRGKIKNREITEYVRREFTPLFRRIRKMDYRLNRKNGSDLISGPIKKIGQLVAKPCEESLKNVAKAGLLSINSLFDLDLYDRINKDCDHFKDAPSLRTHIDYFFRWANARKQTAAPYFALLHVCDIHNPEIFFTYDTEDKELLRSERMEAEKLLDEIPADYHGSLTHDLSLRYIDGVIKYFYDQLHRFGLSGQTIVVICADHGFSFSGNPLRDSAVVNLYLENYNMPFLVTGAGHSGLSITKMCQSKDIPATLCDLVDGGIPSAFTGHSVLSCYEYPHLKIEYCGGGCPDLRRRELKMAVFDKKYFVGTLGTLDDFSEGILTEIYDLENDPMQFNNLVHREYDKDAVAAMLHVIFERKRQIQESGEKIMNNRGWSNGRAK